MAILKKLNKQNTALLVIDVQNAFCSEKGFHARNGVDVSPIKEMVPELKEFIKKVKKQINTVIYTKYIEGEESPENMKVFLGEWGRVMVKRGSFDAEFYVLEPAEDEVVFEKYTWSAFTNPKLDKFLRKKGIKYLIITGVATNMCVDATISSAFDKGYHIIVPKDLVATDARPHRQQLHKLLLNHNWPNHKAHIFGSKDIIKILKK